MNSYLIFFAGARRRSATLGYARRTLHCLAREAERSLMLVGDPLTV